MKNNIPKTLRPYIAWALIFLISTTSLYLGGAYNFCYQEQWQTFIYNSSYLTDTLLQPGGLVQLAAAFLIQFFIHPLTGILITAALLSTVFTCTAYLLSRWIGNNHLAPAALFPVIALGFLHYNTNYLYAGSIAFLLMLIVLAIHLRIQSYTVRWVYSLVCTMLLFIAAGPITTLYILLVCIIEAFHSPKKGLAYLPLIGVVFLMAQCSLWWGYFGEWKHALCPDGYFTLRLQAGSIIYLPWAITLGVFLIAGIYRLFRKQSQSASKILWAIQCIAAGLFLYQGGSQYLSAENETFKELNYHIRHEQWDEIISLDKEKRMINVLHQNCLNLAFAEKGCLMQELGRQPNIGLHSLFIGGNKTPYISGLLNDIYYSMGHMAFSRRYAFEANESMGGYSPKLLKRLVQTSLVYGNYKLALKYIQILEQTLFYQEWAKAHRAFLYNDSLLEADPILGPKRRCIFPDNRFAGSLGLDKDLEEILKQNPTHTSTEQYLKAIELFTGKIPPMP